LQAVNVLQVNQAWQATNRDPNQLSIVVLTGVTAMVRSTAMQMELRGYTFPAENILPFFADADILHTSNEVSFATDCPEPEWTGDPEGFCSSRDYYALLEYIGLDIVELTGNHLNDRGTVPLTYTLDVYDGNQLPYYGGGRDLTDSLEARILTSPNGTRFAFIGCNSAGPYAAWATDASPGAAPCGDWAAITQRIAGLKAAGEADVVIATLQYIELDQYDPSPEQITDFERLASAGADIVSGSQAHQPQGFGYVDGSFIHYGVGNLFFDQMDYIENRQMFADKHVFYGSKHISTILFTGMMEDWAQPRPMTPEERAEFLQLIFDMSPW
jgi:poly-gamma-glutamate synthesis protein (capsule biosynthesis protein)